MTNVTIETNMGNIVIKMRDDMPITVGNFVKLAKKGFYDGLIFHRVIDEFMIQGGCPQGNGMGGSDPIVDEFVGENNNVKGTISMANAGPNTGSSQFFINVADNNFLDDKHPVFGEVIEGYDVVEKISKVDCGPGDKPRQDVKMIKVSVEE